MLTRLVLTKGVLAGVSVACLGTASLCGTTFAARAADGTPHGGGYNEMAVQDTKGRETRAGHVTLWDHAFESPDKHAPAVAGNVLPAEPVSGGKTNPYVLTNVSHGVRDTSAGQRGGDPSVWVRVGTPSSGAGSSTANHEDRIHDWNKTQEQRSGAGQRIYEPIEFQTRIGSTSPATVGSGLSSLHSLGSTNQWFANSRGGDQGNGLLLPAVRTGHAAAGDGPVLPRAGLQATAGAGAGAAPTATSSGTASATLTSPASPGRHDAQPVASVGAVRSATAKSAVAPQINTLNSAAFKRH